MQSRYFISSPPVEGSAGGRSCPLLCRPPPIFGALFSSLLILRDFLVRVVWQHRGCNQADDRACEDEARDHPTRFVLGQEPRHDQRRRAAAVADRGWISNQAPAEAKRPGKESA